MSSNASRGLPTAARYRPQISTSFGVGWRDSTRRYSAPRAARSSGADGEDLAQHGPRPGGGPAVDQRAVHHEQGLGDGAQDVVVGDRGIDPEEPIEGHPRAAPAACGAGLLARRRGSPAASTAFFAAPFFPGSPRPRLGSPRLTGAALACAPGRGFLVVRAGQDQVAVGVQRQAEGLGQGLEDLVGAEPAGASRGERRSCRPRWPSTGPDADTPGCSGWSGTASGRRNRRAATDRPAARAPRGPGACAPGPMSSIGS